MHRQIAFRFVLTALIALAACLRLSAPSAASSTAPVVTFVQANGATIGSGMVVVAVNVADVAGLRSVTLYGANRSIAGYYAAGTAGATVKLFWNTTNYSAGDYIFHCTAFGANGLRSDQAITLHLVK